MSALSKASIIELVKVQSGVSLADTPELNLAPSVVTYCREAKGKGCQTATQVKGFSPATFHFPVVDGFHISGRQQAFHTKKLNEKQLAGSETVIWCQNDYRGTWESQNIPSTNGNCKQTEEVRMYVMMLWQSDKFVVVKKQSNVCGAKGLTCKRQNSLSLQSPMRQQMELRKADSDNSLGKNVCMKSRMWENYKYGFVGGGIADSGNENNWRKL